MAKKKQHTGRRRLPRDFTIMSLPLHLGVLEKARKTSKSYMAIHVNKQLNLVNDESEYELFHMNYFI